MRIVIGLCLALVLVAATPSESSAQPVAFVITVEVAPAQIPAFLAAFGRAAAIAGELGEGEPTLWRSVVGGAPNQLTVVVNFPSIEAWAAQQAANAASTEFQQAFAAVGATVARFISSGLQSQIAPPQ